MLVDAAGKERRPCDLPLVVQGKATDPVSRRDERVDGDLAEIGQMVLLDAGLGLERNGRTFRCCRLDAGGIGITATASLQ
jgi:hypothetical protein